jgi:hypothetical protein
MRVPWRVSQAIRAVAKRAPILGRLQSTLNNTLVRGGLIGGLVLFLLCGILGGLNRGFGGVVVGGLSGSVIGLALGVGAGHLLAIQPLALPKGQRVNLRITLENEDARFLPGDTITGQLLIGADRPVRLRGGSIYLVCRGFQTYDKALENGSREPRFVHSSKEHLVEQADVVPAAVVRRGGTLAFPFSFELPLRSLPTHRGYVYSVLWTLHAVVRLPDGTEFKARHEVQVESIPSTVRGIDGEHQSLAPTQACHMVLSLPSVLVGEGERVNAQVRITPIEGLALTEVRAMLLRVENVAAGDDHTVYVAEWDSATGMFRGQRQPGGRGTTYVWLESEVVLSGPVQLAAAESVIHRFALEVPNQWRPTVSDAEGRVVWKVGVVASRPNQPDLRVFHEVVVHTASTQPRPVLSRSLRS